MARGLAHADSPPSSARSLRALDWLNFFLADVQTGVGPFLAIYLDATQHWSKSRIGLVMTCAAPAGVASQTPAGALVDRLRHKRALVVAGALAIAAAAVLLLFAASLPLVLTAQVLNGVAGSIFPPAIAGITLGIVGHRAMARRVGRNQSYNSAGNVAAAITMGLAGWLIAQKAIFCIVILMAAATTAAVLSIRSSDIDYDRARGGAGSDEPHSDGQTSGQCETAARQQAGSAAGSPAGSGDPPTAAGAAGVASVLRDRCVLAFAASAVLFHFANAAMLPQLGELLSENDTKKSSLFMGACILVTQVVIVLIARPAGALADRLGRKPVALVGFSVLPIRGLLYTLTHNPYALLAIQILDGIGAGIFGVLSIIIIADITRGTGRFNLVNGVVATAIGIGAAISTVVAGWITQHHGYHASFLTLAAIALAAVIVFAAAMPETARQHAHRPPAAAAA